MCKHMERWRYVTVLSKSHQGKKQEEWRQWKELIFLCPLFLFLFLMALTQNCHAKSYLLCVYTLSCSSGSRPNDLHPLPILSLIPSFSLPDVLCDPTDLIWRKGTSFEAMTGHTAPSSHGLLAEVFWSFPQL